MRVDYGQILKRSKNDTTQEEWSDILKNSLAYEAHYTLSLSSFSPFLFERSGPVVGHNFQTPDRGSAPDSSSLDEQHQFRDNSRRLVKKTGIYIKQECKSIFSQ